MTDKETAMTTTISGGVPDRAHTDVDGIPVVRLTGPGRACGTDPAAAGLAADDAGE